MRLRSAPAVVPTLLAFVAFGYASAVDCAPPAPALVALGGLALSLGGGVGGALVGASSGALVGLGAREEAPVNDAALVAETEGEVCGRWHERAEFGSRAARFCPSWVRQGARLLTHPPRLWISLPESAPAPPPGARVVARGSLTRFPGFANDPGRPPGPWRLRVKSSRLVVSTASPGAIARLSSALRAAIDRRLDARELRDRRGAHGVALARGLLLGDDDELPDSLRRALRRCGLMHLLAVSGFNLTLVAGLAALAAGAAGRRRALFFPALVVALYLAAVGQEPSMLRAAFMAGVALALHGVGRSGVSLQALALAAAGLCAIDPALARDPGLQLSCGATAGLLFASKRWSEAFAPLPRALALALGASVAAQLGALPASVAAFGELAPLAPAVNLLALPWATAATLVALAWLFVALVSTPLAAAAAPLLDLLALPLEALDRLPPSLWISTPLEGGATAGVAVALAGAFVCEALRSRRARELALALAFLVSSPRRPEAPEVELVFVDVGQGDAALIRAGATLVLVDGGGLEGRDVGTDVLRPLLVRHGWLRIDAALVSHPHRDHCAGLVELSRHVPIDEVLIAPQEAGDTCVSQLAARAERGAHAMVAGERWGREDLTIEALRPAAMQLGATLPAARGEEANAGSLVVRIQAGGRSLLFAGDISGEEEALLVRERGSLLASDVLKVAHHGSAGSSSPPFLEAVGARLAVVSAGARNPFGHPAREALERLRTSGATVLRTDRDGEVALSWNRGEPIRISLPASPRIDPSSQPALARPSTEAARNPPLNP